MKFCRERTAFTICGTTVSSYPMMPGKMVSRVLSFSISSRAAHPSPSVLQCALRRHPCSREFAEGLRQAPSGHRLPPWLAVRATLECNAALLLLRVDEAGPLCDSEA